jgi:hypothetical protein
LQQASFYKGDEMAFKIEIEGIHDFTRFVNIIRNEPISQEEVERLAKELDKSSDPLKKAVEDNKP